MTLSRTRSRTPSSSARRRPWGRPAQAGPLAAVLAALAALVLAVSPPAAALPSPHPMPATGRADVPSGVTAGVAVFDRASGSFTEQVNPSLPFRSASVVKLLIALDLLGDRGPDALGAQDRARVDAMLRASDDAAAGHFWTVNGGGAIIDRMVRRLGLTDTSRPPATHPGYWGYTALSARDAVRTYRYLLDTAPAPVRDYVMGALRSSTRCAADGYDQHFGVPGAFERPWAVKQGWSGFDSGGCTTPAAAASPAGAAPPIAAAPAARTGGPAAADVDLARPALHTTGTVGTGDRTIVAVLTLHPGGTSYGKAYTDLGRLTRSLDVPGATRPAGTWIGTWGSGVNVRAEATTESRKLTALPAGVEVLVSCQKRGQEVSIPPYTNDWWVYLPQYGGYLTNIYLNVPENQVPGLRLC
ncbi:hypothetical protein [Streptomyces omiyaensis]|uniref:Lipoprotein n=1 Tax=Streptomyces omiyaensis TaxID=68247 RepID=A0ABW7BTG7_9ACTN|nr:hypothetical protein GCM10010363_49890 [Streptomyces omiyaensis]